MPIVAQWSSASSEPGKSRFANGYEMRKCGHGEHAQVARPGVAVPLQGAEVVGVAELVPELLEQLPVVAAAVLADLGVEVRAQVGGDAVVVEQRVVDVEQEDDVHAALRYPA